MLNELIFIALGGATGALMRFGLSNTVYSVFGREFPYGTLSVNFIGSLFIGIFFVLLTERLTYGPDVRAFIMVGLLGAFTTFSTFSLETLLLIQQGSLSRACINIFASVLLCLLATWIGMVLTRSI